MSSSFKEEIEEDSDEHEPDECGVVVVAGCEYEFAVASCELEGELDNMVAVEGDEDNSLVGLISSFWSSCPNESSSSGSWSDLHAVDEAEATSTRSLLASDL